LSNALVGGQSVTTTRISFLRVDVVTSNVVIFWDNSAYEKKCTTIVQFDLYNVYGYSPTTSRRQLDDIIYDIVT